MLPPLYLCPTKHSKRIGPCHVSVSYRLPHAVEIINTNIVQSKDTHCDCIMESQTDNCLQFLCLISDCTVTVTVKNTQCERASSDIRITDLSVYHGPLKIFVQTGSRSPEEQRPLSIQNADKFKVTRRT